MTTRMPPVPPANRSDKGPGGDARPAADADQAANKAGDDRDCHLGEEGRQGNISQNTTNKGYQQNR